MKNYSRQREDLLSILKNSKSHPTAEELYNSIKEKIPSVSRGTVYRNLKDLVDEGYIIKISMAGGADRYDYIHKKHNNFPVATFSFKNERKSGCRKIVHF